MIDPRIRSQSLGAPLLRQQATRPAELPAPAQAHADEFHSSPIPEASSLKTHASPPRPGKVRNLAVQVATALVFGCAGLALVGCGVNTDVDALKTVTTELSSRGKLSEPDCKKVKRQVGPDWFPSTTKVVQCDDKPVSPEQAAKLLAKGKEVHLVRYQQGHWEIPMLNGHTEVVTQMPVRETMKSPADAIALQARLGQAESR